MKSKIYFLTLLLLIIGFNGWAQEKTMRSDGPYIIYNEDKTVRFIQVEPDGTIIDKIINSAPKSFTVTSDDGKHSFDVELSKFKKKKSIVKTGKKTFVLADPHADFDSFVSVLIANNIIDKQFNWNFEDNNLVINGDIFDRGDDATTLLWLIYKLQVESEKLGGDVFHIIGNHEDMVLKGDDRYINKKYAILADTLNIEHKELYSKQSELGKWVRLFNIIQVIDGNMFVHAGLGKDFLKRGLDLKFINSSTKQYLGSTKKELKEIGGDIAFLYGSFGPIWYRGMVRDDEKYKPISTVDVNKIIEMYDVDKIILGHTIFDDVTVLHDGKVIAVNVNNKKNFKNGKGRGILIDNDEIFIVYDKKDSKKLIGIE